MGKVYDFTLTVGADDSAANQVLALLEKNLAKATKKENVISITADATNVEKALKELVELNPTVGANIELKVDQSSINKEIDFLNSILNSKTELDADKIVSKFKSAFTSGIKSAKLGDILSDEVGDSSKSIANVQKAVDSIVSRITNVDISESMDMSEMTSYVKDLETASALINEISKNKKLTKVDLSALTSVVDSNKLKSAYSQIGQNVFMNSEQLLENLQQKSLSVVSDFQKRLGDILRYGAGYEIVSSDELDKEKAKLAEMEQALARTSQSADQLEDRMIAVANSIEKYEDAGDDSKVRSLQQELLQLAEIYKSNEGIDLFDDEALDDESLDYLKTAIYAVLDAKDELKDFHFQLVSEEDVEKQRALVSDLQNNITSVQKEVNNAPLVDEQSTARIKELETEVENLREDLASAQLEARQLGEDLSTAQAELYEATYNQRTVEDFDNADKVKELEKQVDYLSEKLREAQGTINEFANELTTAERKLESALEQQKIDISIEPTVEPEEFAAKLSEQLTSPAKIEVEGKVTDPEEFARNVGAYIDTVRVDVGFGEILDDEYNELQKRIEAIKPGLALEVPIELSAKETAQQTQLAADAIEAEGDKAEEAAKAKEEFAEANIIVAKSSEQTAKKTEEAAFSINDELNAAKDKGNALKKFRDEMKATDGVVAGMVDTLDDDRFSFERVLNFAQRQKNKVSYDSSAKQYKVDSTLVSDYKKLGNAIAESDVKMVKLFADAKRFESQGIDNSATLQLLDAEYDKSIELRRVWSEMRNDPAQMLGQNEDDWLATIRAEAQEQAQLNIEQKEAIAIANAQGKAIDENTRRIKQQQVAEEKEAQFRQKVWAGVESADNQAVNALYSAQEKNLEKINQLKIENLNLDKKRSRVNDEQVAINNREIARLETENNDLRQRLADHIYANADYAVDRQSQYSQKEQLLDAQYWDEIGKYRERFFQDWDDAIIENAKVTAAQQEKAAKAAADAKKKTDKASADAQKQASEEEKARQKELSDIYDRQSSIIKEKYKLKKESLSLNENDSVDAEKLLQKQQRINALNKEYNELTSERAKVDLSSDNTRDYNQEKMREMVVLIQQENDALKDQQRIIDATAGKTSLSKQNEQAARAYKDLTKQAKTYYKLLDKEASGSLTGSEKSVLERLKQEWEDATAGVGKYSIALADTTNNFASATAAANKFYDSASEEAVQASNRLAGYATKLEELIANPGGFKGLDLSTTAEELLDRINAINKTKIDLNSEDARNDIIKLDKDAKEFFDTLRKSAKEISIGNIKNEISDYLSKNTKLSMKFRVELYKLSKELSSGLPDDRLKQIYKRFTDIRIEARNLGEEGSTSLGTISQRLGDMDSKFIAQLLSWQDIIRYIRIVAESVRDLDTALTEMRKVSDESVESLRAYQDISFDLADDIGSTGLQIQKSTADFMRLGETLDEAQKSASTANILMNVSEFESISEATDSLIAMSAAYSDLEKIDIVNKLNKIGNEYAVSTDGIATALQSSASALVTAHNDIDEAIALVTAGNLVTQDPNKVGTGLRTIALRLTGTKAAAAELTEIGEEVDDMITTQSKLRQTILDATKVASNNFKGFDILDENGNYRSTYEIMLGLSQIYREIEEQDKKLGRNNLNLLLETIAGKNRANIAASILQNPATLAEAFDDSKLRSTNSALEENQKYLESIEGHLQRFQNAVQDLFHSLIDSGTVNKVLDIATDFINLLDRIVETLGSTGSLVATGGLILLLRNLGPITDHLIKNLPALIEGFQLVSVGAGTFSEALPIMLPNIAKLGTLLAPIAPYLLAIAAALAAVGIGIAIFDALTISVKESQKKINEYNESIETLTAELQQLRDLDNKTSYDNKRISQLEKELEIQKKLLEIEQQRYYQNLTERSIANSFDSDNIATQQARDTDNYQNRNSTAATIRDVEKYAKRLSEIQEELNTLYVDFDNAVDDKERNKIAKKISDLQTEQRRIQSGNGADRYSALIDKYSNYVSQEEQLVEALTAKTANGYNMLTGKAREDALKELDFARNKIKEITEAVRNYEIVIGTFDPFNSITGIASENTFNEAEIIKAVESTGSLEDAQKRLMAQFPSLAALCSKYGITLEELVEHYWEEKEAIEAVVEAEAKQENSLSTAVSNMNKRILPQFDALEKVYQEIFNGDKGFDLSKIGTDDLESIRAAFQDIDESLDIDWAGKTEDVDKFLSVIGNSSSTASEVHDAFDDLATAYFNAAVSAEDFTEENAKVLEQMLKEMGVINASDVVKSVRDLRAIPDALSQLKLPDNFDEGITDAIENLENEFAKLEDPDWGISAENIQKVKDGTIQSVFGNVDMDKRAIITWSEELKKEYKRELDSWEYDPEIGGIDTVFGGSGGFSLGNGQELTVAFTPIIETDEGAEMVAYDTLMDYIQTIVDQATEDGTWSLDEILALDQKGIKYDRYDEYGRKIGEQVVKGVIAGVGSDAIEIGSLMHFSGEAGAVELATEELEAYNSVKEKLEQGTLSLENITAQEIAVLEKEGAVSVETANQIRLLALQKILNNENWINESNSIAQVIALARAAGIAIPALTALAEVQAAISNAQMVLSGEIAGNRVQALKDLQYYTWYGKELGARVANEVSTGVANIDYGPAKESAGNGGSETGDAYVEAFEKELKALEEQRDAGVISEKEFLDKYKALIEKYFKDVDGYGDEYAKRMGDYFQRAISYYESVFSAVGTLLDKRISAAQEGKEAAVDALNAEKDAALAAYDAQIEAIDELIDAKNEQIDLLDDEIDAIQDQIDAINDAAAARQRELDLQKAEYNLQRAMNQRTKLVKLYMPTINYTISVKGRGVA